MITEQATEMEFTDYTAEDLIPLAPYFALRPVSCCESTPIDAYIWKDFCSTGKAVIDGRCLMLISRAQGRYDAALPLCRPDELPYYFCMQEQYFNRTLGVPHVLSYADEEGVELLKDTELLSGYDIRECESGPDYIYEAEKLRTLSGRRLSRKRNHIHRFEESFRGRWEYRSLVPDDRDGVMEVLNLWEMHETGTGSLLLNEDTDTPELKLEYRFVKDAFSDRQVFEAVQTGGIFIDGRLKGFSIGSYNSLLRMAVVHVEKADPAVEGLYQVINREFILHEYPDALLVNREDDAGDEGIRTAKLSYFPDAFGKRYCLRQRMKEEADARV